MWEKEVLDADRDLRMIETPYIASDRVWVFYQTFWEIPDIWDQYLLCEDWVILCTEDSQDLLISV